MICNACGVEAPTKHVEFHQNIGALIMRFHHTAEGDMCKSCVHKFFWRMTLVNLFLGWWGVISFFVTPVFIMMNVVRYVPCLGMLPVPALAERPELTDQIIAKLQPHTEQIIARMRANEDLKTIATDTAYVSGVTPGQVLLYIHALLKVAQSPPKQ
ncbi:MAG TPA: hypothetical protein VNM37_02360 [Candidatus Dormibacteraeota bacterium]|nr:hypothetical protein [Candidatus Dormibacteraeota bacterium]